jgi:division/cell wall cluster transcriptional repressor MraZ
MTTEIIFAGFGGQGVILAGKILTLAGMSEDKYVSHIPSYGAEMRGGTANCSVIVSDDEVASPVIEHPDVVVALNKPSMVKFEAQLKALPLTNENARKFVRYFAAGATECQVDKQGRILIPANLKEYAGLKKDIVITGVSTRAEIWDKEKWDAYTSSENIDLDEVASHMSDFGI